MQGIGLSPAQIVFGRELRDTMPFKPGKGAMHKEWRVTAEDREKALAKRHVTSLEKLNRHAKRGVLRKESFFCSEILIDNSNLLEFLLYN